MSSFFPLVNKRAEIAHCVLWCLYCSVMDWFAANGSPNEIFADAPKVTCQSHTLSASIFLPSQTLTSCLFPALFFHVFRSSLLSFPHLGNTKFEFLLYVTQTAVRADEEVRQNVLWSEKHKRLSDNRCRVDKPMHLIHLFLPLCCWVLDSDWSKGDAAANQRFMVAFFC